MSFITGLIKYLGFPNARLNSVSLSEDDGTLYERPSAVSLNSVPWRQIVSKQAYTGGEGVGGENYNNEVVAMGWNILGVGTRADDAKAAFYDTWEFKFNNAGVYGGERHIEMLTTAGVNKRVASWFMPHNGGAGSSFRSTIDQLSWYRYDDARAPILWDIVNDRAFCGSSTVGFQFYFDKNNTAPFNQRNAANSAYLLLPYFDSSNKLVITGNQQANPGAVPSGGNSGVTYSFAAADIPNGCSAFTVNANTQTNSEFNAFYADGNTNFRIKNGLRNTHATGFAVDMVIATGSAFYRATDFTHDWSWGKNASNNFFLGKGDPGSNTIFTVDKTNFNLAFSTPPQIPSYTVATVPSASTFVRGQIYVSDETGGAVPAFSDGTNWRRVTDRAVVS